MTPTHIELGFIYSLVHAYIKYFASKSLNYIIVALKSTEKDCATLYCLLSSESDFPVPSCS